MNEVTGLDLQRSDLVSAAHQAELVAGTGQGDVFIQDRGGIVWNTGDGIQQRERSDPIEYTSYESIDTADVLGDEAALERIAEHGREALRSFDPSHPLPAWLRTAWQFAQASGLATDRVTNAIRQIEAKGGTATMAMLGETVVGTPGPGVFDAETAISPTGPTIRR